MLAPLGQSLDVLSTEVAALLTSASASEQPQVLILANTPRLAGLGGFVGLNTTPAAELYARHLDAEIAVRVFADTAADLLSEVAQATRDLLGVDPSLLRQRGIFSIKRLTEREAPLLTSADGLPTAFGRDLHFQVRFEHRPLPTESEGVLGSVPVDTTVAALSRQGRLIYANDFSDDPLGDFQTVDVAGGAGTAGAWSHDVVAGEVIQTGSLRGGRNGLQSNKTGSYLLLAPSAGPDVTNFVLNAEMRCGTPGGIGLVYRYIDERDFSYVLMEEPAGVRVFAQRNDNRFGFLSEGGQDSDTGFQPDTWMRVRLLVDEDRVELAIDEQIVLSGRDATLIRPGAVGFFCRRADTARFRHFRLSSL